MQYIVRNRRRLRPATSELARARTTIPAATTPPPVAAEPEPAPVAEGSGLHRRLLVTEINLTRPFQGRGR